MSFKEIFSFLDFIKFFQGGRTGAEFPHSGRSVPAESDQPAAPLVHQARHPGWMVKSHLVHALLFTLPPGASRQRLPALSTSEERGTRGAREPGGAK